MLGVFAARSCAFSVVTKRKKYVHALNLRRKVKLETTAFISTTKLLLNALKRGQWEEKPKPLLFGAEENHVSDLIPNLD